MEPFSWFWFLLWVFIIGSAFMPLVHQRMLEAKRLQIMDRFEKKRGSRVIAMIHRQECISFLGIHVARYVDIDDSEQVLRAIRLTPPDIPIDFILHTPGGLALAAEQIARALKRHPSKVTVFVPHYALSGGTLIALAADEIVMDENAVLGPLDPQLGEYPVASILKVVREKEKKDLEDRTLILADVAEKALRQMREFVFDLIRDKLGDERAKEVAQMLTEGRWTHDYPLTFEHLREMGFKVSTDMPQEIYALMELYPQPPQRRPSVQYIPVPYTRPREGLPGRERGT
ncbi:MAG TPA: hypothetical protein EYP65_08225 [Armatimonadetes bacterium]|nr:hypothetical protein [Armatimonadota bacterium]